MTTHAPPSTSSNDAPTQTSGYKRRRLSSQKNKEELAYTASTIHKRAFIQGNRREHALPIGCGVDTCTVKLVTAAEYDDDRWSSGSSDEDGGRQLQSNQLQQGQGQQEEDCKCKDETGESSSSNNSNMNDAAVIEMQLYANLVTSTRQSYYTDDLALETKSTSNRRSTATASNRTAATTTTTTINGNLRSSSPNSSEGNSTWSHSLLEDTTTTLNDLNANHTKNNIDNDNRSDGQSSNMGNCGWYSSDDSDSSSSSDDDDDDDDDKNESKKYEENEGEILRQQCDLGHQVQQEQQRGHDKVDSSRLHCLDEPYSVVG